MSIAVEPPITPEGMEQEPDETHQKRQTPGSCAFVPSAAGLIMAGEIIRDLAGIRITNDNEAMKK